MNGFRLKRMNLSQGLALAASCALMAGCQESESPVQTAAEPQNAGYAAEASGLKARIAPELYETELAKVQQKYGIASPAGAPAELSGKPEVLQKTANVTYLNASTNWSQDFRNVFLAHPGDAIRLTADPNSPGADPMLAVIQFDDANFKATGVVPFGGQLSYRIVAFNDDRASNDLGSTLAFVVPQGVSGYLMFIAIPYASNTQGRVKMSYQRDNVNCPTCDEFWFDKPGVDHPLSGSVFRGFPGNKFTVNAPVGDPVLFVFKNSSNQGYFNDDSPGLGLGSQVFIPPFGFSAAEAGNGYNFSVVTAFGTASGSGSYVQAGVN